ncbi:SGNH/GDSL hydrolase family protein [Arthrobacter sp. NPDC056691]|uniref:SGNH/GDSL hydrolase family protein n=1 Tax=Arthrobacter sp. NPDC056691 TaxID=3345913 RepID=UPI00366ACE1C
MRRKLTAAVLAAGIALSAGCAQTPPPVSGKVQEYYDENIANAKATLAPAAAPAQKVVFLGDSYTFGSGASSMQLRWSSIVARNLSWGEINIGVGDTGYSNPGTNAGGTTYDERVAKVVASKPAIVVVSGGRYDVVQRDAQVLVNAVATTFKDIRRALPKARIVALSPVWDASAPPAELAAVAEDVRSAVGSVGGTYIDVGQPLMQHPEAISADGVHPNDAGHKLLADATVKALTKAGIEAG